MCEEKEENISEEIWYEIVVETINGYEENITLTVDEKNHLTTVMKSIEILFVVYFSCKKDEVLAKDAAKLFRLVCDREKKLNRIIRSINNVEL